MKKLVYLSLALIIVGGLTGCSLGRDKKEGQVTVAYVATDVLEVDIKEIKTDKSNYQPEEDIVVSIKLDSSQKDKEVLMAVSGFIDIYGDSYINKKEFISVSGENSQEISYTFTLPEYSACEGFSEGDHIIRAAILQEGIALAEEEISFSFNKSS